MCFATYPFFVLIILALSCNQKNLSDQNFRFHPDPHKLYYVTINRVSSVGELNGHDKNAIPEKIEFVLKLIKVADSNFLLKLTFQNYSIKHRPITFIQNGVKNVFTDTSKIDNNPFQIWDRWLSFTKGLPEYIWMNNKGEVLSVTGFEKIVDSVAVLSKNKKDEIKYYLQDYLGEKNIRDNLNELFSIAPNFKETINNSWVRNIVLINKAPVKLSNMYTLTNIKNDTAELDIVSVISARAAENADPFMEGNGNGKIMIQYSSGIPYSYTIRKQTKTTTEKNIYPAIELFSATIKCSEY